MRSKEIKKENIPLLQFPKRDVYETAIKKHSRLEKLKKAMVSGNALKHKVKIYFTDAKDKNEHSEIKHVQTTVWFVSDKHVVLKYGIVIPINSIIDVEL